MAIQFLDLYEKPRKTKSERFQEAIRSSSNTLMDYFSKQSEEAKLLQNQKNELEAARPFAQALNYELTGKESTEFLRELQKTGLKHHQEKQHQGFLNQLMQKYEGAESQQEPTSGIQAKGIMAPEFGGFEGTTQPKEPIRKGKKESKLIPEEIIAGLPKSEQQPLLKRNERILKERELEEKKGLKEKELEYTKFQKEREYHTQFTKPILQEASNILARAPQRKALMNQWKQDVASGQTSGIGPFMVDRTGLEFWRNPESARFKNIGKTYFIDTLDTLSPGTRLNQFLERVAADALPNIGRDEESQLSVLELQDLMDSLKEKRAQILESLAEEDREKYGFEQKDIDSRANKLMGPIGEELQKQASFKIRQLHEDRLDDKQLANEVFMGKIPEGTPITPRVQAILMLKNNDDPYAAAREAQKLGFELPRKKNESK